MKQKPEKVKRTTDMTVDVAMSMTFESMKKATDSIEELTLSDKITSRKADKAHAQIAEAWRELRELKQMKLKSKNTMHVIDALAMLTACCGNLCAIISDIRSEQAI